MQNEVAKTKWCLQKDFIWTLSTVLFKVYKVFTIALSALGLFSPPLALTFLANPALQFVSDEKFQLTLA